MTRSRKRFVLVEKITTKKPSKYATSEVFNHLTSSILHNNELFVKNRFSIELERSDGLKIDESRIKGFKIITSNGHKVLMVKTYLHIKEWITDYEKVIIAKIAFLDNIGNEINNLDLDICFDGYFIECDYSLDDVVTPEFSYTILD